MLDRGDNPVAEPLVECLRRKLGQPSLRYQRPPRPLAGGKFSEVYVLELVPQPEGWDGTVVCRLLRSSDQTRLEAALSVAAVADGLSAPRLLMSEPDAPELGGGYLVMERVPGRTYLRGVDPWKFVLDLPKLLSSWPTQFAKVVGALGRVDVDRSAATLERHGVPNDLARPGRHLRAVSSLLADEPMLAAVVGWLHDNEPAAPERLALVHGDLWPGNVFVDGDAIRLIDWTREAGSMIPPSMSASPRSASLSCQSRSRLHPRSASSCTTSEHLSPDESPFAAIRSSAEASESATTKRCAVPLSSPTSSPGGKQAIEADGNTAFRPWSATSRASPEGRLPSGKALEFARALGPLDPHTARCGRRLRPSCTSPRCPRSPARESRRAECGDATIVYGQR